MIDFGRESIACLVDDGDADRVSRVAGVSWRIVAEAVKRLMASSER